MKHLYFLSLLSALLFDVALSKSMRFMVLPLRFPKCEVDPNKTEGCNREMRVFGPNYQYRCNCKHASSCDFQNNGICQNDTCLWGFGGPYCQQVAYDASPFRTEYISLKNYLETIGTRKYDNLRKFRYYSNEKCRIIFHQNFRINYMSLNCRWKENITIYFGPNKIYENECRHEAQFNGSVSSENAIIGVTSRVFIHLSGCMPLWFGIDCDMQCHCANNAECDVLTGVCPLGCENGWRGHNCQEVNFENVALNKKAKQSSTQNKGLIFKNGTCQTGDILFSANLAVDGNINQQVERFSCMQTQKEMNPFWEVDLGKKYNISQIRIYNMNSMRTFYFGRISVFVDGEICNNNTFITPTAPSVIDIMCTNALPGTSVKIIHNGFASLHFCEVEVLQCLPGYCGYRCSFNCSKYQTENDHQLPGQYYDNSNELNNSKAEFYIIPLVIGISILIVANVIQVIFCLLRKKSKTKTDAKTEVKPKPAEMKTNSVKDVEYRNVNNAENDENLYDTASIDTAEGVITNIHCAEENLYENEFEIGRGTNRSKVRMQMRRDV